MKGFRKSQYFFWILLIIILSFASFWHIFSFGFWKDDWSLMWSSLYNTHYYHGYFNHPGTPLEFFFLSHIFGIRAFLWQATGFILHVFISVFVGLFTGELTKSKKVGILAGIFFAASYLGLEGIYYPSAQVVQLAAIPLLLFLSYFIRSLSSPKQNLPLAISYWLLAIFIDPPRVVPIILLLPILLVLFPKSTYAKFYKKIFLFAYPILFFVTSLALIWWFNTYALGTLLGKAIHQGLLNPSFIIQKLHVFGHFFATIANIFTGLIYGLSQDEQNTGIYNRFFAYVGIGIFLVTIGIGAAWARSKKRLYGILTFFLLWIVLFYLPNWVSEPRAPMAGTHRYIFLSSIGFVGLIAYVCSFIKSAKLLISVSILFLALNIYKANILLAWQYSYRSDKVITNIWNTINRDVPLGEQNSIFMIFGAQPWVSEDIGLSGAAPFALLRNGSATQFTDPSQMPIITVDTKAITHYLCYKNQKIINLYYPAYKKDRILLSHIHAWKVLPGGRLVDVSEKERALLTTQAKLHSCTPL